MSTSTKRKSMERRCEFCRAPFQAPLTEVNRGGGRFCSHRCAASKKPLLERFWERVQKTEGCWLWTAGTHTFGYGVISQGAGKTPLSAHRLSWEIHFGPIPKGLHVLHGCDNPRCVNPVHLFLGTQTDNMADMTAKGRRAKGNQYTRRKK